MADEYSYTIKRDKVYGLSLSDTWWKGGFGFNYDMNHLLLKLDHMFYSDKDIELMGIKVLKDWKFSDHYPLVADLK